jgi:hypothetical protein
MKPLLALILTLWLPAALGNNPIIVESGPNQKAVVELYTSEGCSSCPPAERWLKELADMPLEDADVMPLAFHVDYWDYIGWKDEFASPAFTQRQHELAAKNDQASVYTPEFFVDGEEKRGVFRILQSVRKANATPAPVKLRMQITQDRDHLRIALQNQFKADTRFSIRFVVFENDLANMIKRGENRGKFLQHQRVVRYLSEAQPLHSENHHAIDIAPAWNRDGLGVGVLVTRQADHRPVQSLFALLKPGSDRTQ